MPVRLLIILVCAVAVVSCSGGSTATPASTPTPAKAPYLAGGYQGANEGTIYQPAGDPVAYRVCAEGNGWVRPSLDDQRRHLASLGGEFQQLASDPGSLFQGAYLGRDAHGNISVGYSIFWTFVSEPKDEQYAPARSGLWSATPNAAACDRSAGLTLLIEHEVTDMRFDGETVWVTARYVPGYFEYIEYTLPADIHSVGYQLLNEDGTWIDACCS